MKIQPTSNHGIELRGSLHGLALLLGELIFELLLLGGRRLVDLLELSLKVDNPLLLLCAFFSRSAQPLALCASDCCKVTRSSKSFQLRTIKSPATCCGQLTVSALLMVTMLVRKACMSSLSSNRSSCQGV
jgi:hypothetical protein